MVAVAAFTTYLVTMPAQIDSVAGTQASTAALTTLMIGGAWVMITTARPYQWWKLLMIALCALAAFATIFWLPGWYAAGVETLPWLVRFNPQLDPSNAAMMSTGIWTGLAAAAIVEALWWISGRITGQHRHLFGSLADR